MLPHLRSFSIQFDFNAAILSAPTYICNATVAFDPSCVDTLAIPSVPLHDVLAVAVVVFTLLPGDFAQSNLLRCFESFCSGNHSN